MHDVINKNTVSAVMKNRTKNSMPSRQWQPVWNNVIFFSLMHIGSAYGIYLLITKAKWQTIVFDLTSFVVEVSNQGIYHNIELGFHFTFMFLMGYQNFLFSIINKLVISSILIADSYIAGATTYVLYIMSNVGATAGAHRLWSHRSYKVKLPLKIILLFFFTMTFQGSVFQWVRDHRVHHKYCDTDADPHNSRRGFFFSHIGWLLMKKHPDVTAKGRDIEMSDIKADKLLRFQKKYYYAFVLLISYTLPTYIPVLWNEEKWIAFYIAAVLRLTISLHAIFLVNSVAHKWGTKPYDENIRPVETKAVSLVACGEGFHNYHHTFPWDYKAAELGGYSFNTSRLFIDIMARIGWAYDLKTVSQKLIANRVNRTGDGTHPQRQ